MLLDRRPQWGFVEIILIYLGIMVSSILFVAWQEEFAALLLTWGIPYNESTFFISAFLVQFFVTVLLIYVFAIVVNKASFRDLGFKVPAKKELLYYGVGGGILLLMIVFLLSIPIAYLNPNLEPQPYEEILRELTQKTSVVWLVIIGVVLAPLSEEMFYRGIIYPVFRRHLGPTWGIVISGIIFGLAHFDLWRAIPLAIGGMGLCYIYEKTRSILVTTVAHGVWNLIMTLMVLQSIQLLT
ncbi:MAG: CPBP family intramembrane metalloprotease [Syntrophomonadaceae bacterium]|nr:CPBP family intramembrane metalloprotease [Syntrophomonadaceae bacterium]